MVAYWEARPRDKSLGRNYDPIRHWSSITVVERHNVLGAKAGTWAIVGPTRSLGDLLAAGSGVMLFRDGVERMSGPMTEVSVGAQTTTVSGVSDTAEVLGDRILYPVPSSPFSNQKAAAYDNRTGPAEDVLLGYIAANTGSGTTIQRQTQFLRTPASLHRGKTVTITGRLEDLATTAFDIAETAGFHLEVLHREGDDGVPYLDLTLTPVADRTANVRFGAAGGFSPAVVDEGWSYTLSRPTLTRAMVAGGGQLTDRVFLERANIDAEALWGARIEQLVDQRQTTDATELAQAGDDAVADGSNPVSVSFTVSDSPEITYGVDWRIGDTVGVNLPGLVLDDVVREVTTTVSAASSGPSEKISAIVGSRDSSKWVSRTNKDVAKALRSLTKLQAT